MDRLTVSVDAECMFSKSTRCTAFYYGLMLIKYRRRCRHRRCQLLRFRRSRRCRHHSRRCDLSRHRRFVLIRVYFVVFVIVVAVIFALDFTIVVVVIIIVVVVVAIVFALKVAVIVVTIVVIFVVVVDRGSVDKSGLQRIVVIGPRGLLDCFYRRSPIRSFYRSFYLARLLNPIVHIVFRARK